MRRIGVLANVRKPLAAGVLSRLAARARALKLEVVACEETARLAPGLQAVPENELADRADVLVALGGDGTVLHAARILEGKECPVLGVNLGSLGFLTSVTQEDVERAVDALQNGTYTTSVRVMADCRLLRDGECLGRYRALNDVVVGWGVSSRIITLDVSVDNESVAAYTCDGLIVSTPTGSTGHSLSAGGPILHPASACFVISVICPHTLSHRPLVVSDRSVVRVRVVRASKKLLLSVDGQEEYAVEQGDSIEVNRSPHAIRFVHLPGYSYFSVLRQKLHWRGSSV
jgi:NAD+ kinase